MIEIEILQNIIYDISILVVVLIISRNITERK